MAYPSHPQRLPVKESEDNNSRRSVIWARVDAGRSSDQTQLRNATSARTRWDWGPGSDGKREMAQRWCAAETKDGKGIGCTCACSSNNAPWVVGARRIDARRDTCRDTHQIHTRLWSCLQQYEQENLFRMSVMASSSTRISLRYSDLYFFPFNLVSPFTDAMQHR